MALDSETLAEKFAILERHLDRVQSRLPLHSEDFQAGTDACDSVILHLWQAIQITLDVAITWCIRRNLGAPTSYANAFERLAQDGAIDQSLAQSMIRAVGLRNRIAHTYEEINLSIVYVAAKNARPDLQAFFRAARDGLHRMTT